MWLGERELRSTIHPAVVAKIAAICRPDNLARPTSPD